MKRGAYLAALVALSLAAVPAIASGGANFAGKTGDGHSVKVRVSNQRVAIAFASRFRCSNGSRFVARAGYRGLKLHGKRFSVKLANRRRSIRTRLTGTISGRSASGTISRRAKFNRARKLDRRGHLTCTSRTSWRARKR